MNVLALAAASFMVRAVTMRFIARGVDDIPSVSTLGRNDPKFTTSIQLALRRNLHSALLSIIHGSPPVWLSLVFTNSKQAGVDLSIHLVDTFSRFPERGSHEKNDRKANWAGQAGRLPVPVRA
jgi:hypothetical protein